LKFIQLFTVLKVFPCSASNCGHFYHPECVARLLCADDQNKAEELQAKIAARDCFACPLHTCKLCNMSEDKNQYACILLYADVAQQLITENVYLGKPFFILLFPQTPTGHRFSFRYLFSSFVFRDITSELNSDDETLQRAWESLLPYNRILIYCL